MKWSPRSFAGFLPTDDPRWPDALGKVRHDIFHMPGYLDACALTKVGEPLGFLIDTGAQGMLVPLIKRPLNSFGADYQEFHDVVSPYGYSGPVCWGDPDPRQFLEMFQVFLEKLRENKIVSLFLRLHPFLGPTPDLLAGLDPVGELKPQGPVVYLDLLDPEGSWNGINAGNRRAIRRSLLAGCTVSFDQWETMDQVLAAYEETMRRHDAEDQYFFPWEFFLRLRESTSPHFHLATSFNGHGAVTGGVFFSEVDGMIHYFITGTFAAYASLSPSKLLINALRLWGLERGCHTLNLGGGLGAREDNLFTFKIRLSKSTALFNTFRMVLLPDIYRELSAGAEDDGSFFPFYRRPLNHQLADGHLV